jgi:hypothetical protein
LRRILAAGALLACLFAAAPPVAAPGEQAIRLRAERVPLNASDPAQTTVGDLRYAWGVRLTASGTSRFGGLSGLEVADLPGPSDGRSPRRAFTAVSDDGAVITFTGRDAAVGGAATMRTLPGLEGQPLQRKKDRDAEGLAIAGGESLVSFEGSHRIWNYGDDFARRPVPVPAPQAALRANIGFEGLAVLPGANGGTLAVGAEDGRMWLCPRRGGTCPQALSRGGPQFGYWLTSLDHLPGSGDLVALYRFYNPLNGATPVIVAWIPVRDGKARIVPLAELSGPLTHGNFEGIAAVPHGEGWRLHLISDDGLVEGARTLLLALDWTPRRKGPASPPAP